MYLHRRSAHLLLFPFNHKSAFHLVYWYNYCMLSLKHEQKERKTTLFLLTMIKPQLPHAQILRQFKFSLTRVRLYGLKLSL